jgi:osmotically-inducible protein OsmY
MTKPVDVRFAKSSLFIELQKFNHAKERRKCSMKKSTHHLALVVTVASLFFITTNLFASETDDRIESSAKQSYVFKIYLTNDDIRLQSKDGAVTLSGTVAEDSYKLLAEDTITSLPGVKSFDNQLRVKSELPVLSADEWLTAKVKFSLMFYRSLTATDIEVIAKDGEITLRGEATSTAQKDLATETTKDMDGVKDVKNEMTVAQAAKKTGEKTIGEKIDAMSGSIDDASITALVKTTLLYHRSTSALKTTVETKEGVVKLGGKASNVAEKELATKYVADVHGVKIVVNDMIVE